MTLTEVLQHFDRVDEKNFDEQSISTELHKVVVPDGTQPPFELIAERIAFAFMETKEEDGEFYKSMMTWKNKDGTLIDYPSIGSITPEMITYWIERYIASVNPIMVARYSGLVWDFQLKVTATKPDLTVCKDHIKAILSIASGAFFKASVYCLWKLQRALVLSTRINDILLVDATKAEIISVEDKYSEDAKPGLWGYSFDLLLNNKRKLANQREEEKIIQDLEGRLLRLTTVQSEEQKIDPWGAEAAAERLAKYYRDKGRAEDIKRVIVAVGDAFQKIERDGSAIQLSGWLDHLHKLYLRYGLVTEANASLLRLRELGPKMAEELTPFPFSLKFKREKLENYANGILSGTVEEVLVKLALTNVPKRQHVKEQLENQFKAAPFMFMGATHLQDDKGRVIAVVGSLEKDLEGHIILQVSQNLNISSIFLRYALKEALVLKTFSKEDILKYIQKNPALHVKRYSLIDRGLEAYFNHDYVEALHILIPQIEEMIRNLIELWSGVVLRESRGGGFQLRTLDDLLRDSLIEENFGEDISTYFRILLTDKRGWNLRNKVCHGMIDPDFFTVELADRIIHALLCIGLIREKKTD